MIPLRAFILVAVSALTRVPALAQSTDTTVSGFFTDTLCGARGATERHVECAKRTVASGKAKYAFYDDTERKLYIIEPQEATEPWLGQRVKITGTVSKSALKRAGQSLDPETGKLRRHNSLFNDSTPIATVPPLS